MIEIKGLEMSIVDELREQLDIFDGLELWFRDMGDLYTLTIADSVPVIVKFWNFDSDISLTVGSRSLFIRRDEYEEIKLL